MTQPIEIHAMNAKTNPTRSLIGRKPMHYVNAVRTDIRRTFRRFRLLDYLRRRSARSATPLDLGLAAT